QYPSVAWVQNVATGTADVKYPYHINEFAHSMGNALGNFAQYWQSMDSTNFFIGGAIWDWVDQSLWNWTADGTRYLASGGNFGDKPNDGQFVMNGILNGDRSPKPQYYEVKKVYQNLYTTLVGMQDSRVIVQLFNRNYYEPVSYDARWTLLADGEEIRSGRFETGALAPRTKENHALSIGPLPEGKECYLNLSYTLQENLPWAEEGFEACKEQLFLQKGTPVIATPAKGRALKTFVDDKTGHLVVKGRRFRAEFDAIDGSLSRLKYRGRDVIVPGQGPRLNAFRALVNNDAWYYEDWFAQGLHNLQHKAVSTLSVNEQPDGTVTIDVDIVSQAPNGAHLDGSSASATCRIVEDPDSTSTMQFTSHVIWTVARDGSLTLRSHITSDKPDLVLGRLGYILQVPARLGRLTYYGRGPEENYSDRYTCAFVGIHSGRVSDQVGNYTKPQDMANHEQVRWAALTRARRGVVFEAAANSMRQSDSGTPVLSLQALPYRAVDLVEAAHAYELPAPGDTWLCLDAAVTGLGGASCGPLPLPEDRVHSDADFGFTIRMR
ncbi:MAG: DUF4981 domain-containing protein, partial [Bacteroidales bacterium]|nr:DUF4981 domain-containing protein [Bacteroidales bacterium]